MVWQLFELVNIVNAKRNNHIFNCNWFSACEIGDL